MSRLLKLFVAALLLSPRLATGSIILAQDMPQTQQNPDPEASSADREGTPDKTAIQHPVLWHRQENIGSLDLLHGQGGEKMPKAPFTFEREDLNGSNPKMDVLDAAGRRWRVKLGSEARPEVAASRLLWAMGYAANDDYVLPHAEIAGINMRRGKDLIQGEIVTDARFSRKPKGEKKIGTWEWKQNPFSGTREFNGLRVMMAVMNNWDLKDENNAIYNDPAAAEQLFLVSDVGATFGGNSLGLSRDRSKGDVNTFADSKFITHRSKDAVSFATPKPPTSILAASFGASAKQYFYRRGLQWIGRDIPIADARWMGEQLGQLSHQQLVDAFRAGNFPDAESDVYVKLVESRIAELKQL